MLLSSNAAAVALANGLDGMGVDLHFDHLGDTVAKLEVRGGLRRLTLDLMSAPEVLCWAMTEALCALTFGEGAAPNARRPRPRLRLVG